MVKFHTLLLASIFSQSSAFTGVQSFKKKRIWSISSLNMSSIKSVKAREILDSRGNPTVEVRHSYPSHPLNPSFATISFLVSFL